MMVSFHILWWKSSRETDRWLHDFSSSAMADACTPASYCFNTVYLMLSDLSGLVCLLSVSWHQFYYRLWDQNIRWCGFLFYCGICCPKQTTFYFFSSFFFKFCASSAGLFTCMHFLLYLSVFQYHDYSTLCALLPKCVGERFIKPQTPICQHLPSATPSSFFGEGCKN